MTVLYLHAMATWFMVGLIWFVQIVHYPLLTSVGLDDRAHYAREHGRRTSWVVAPGMGLEATTAIWLVVQPPEHLVGSVLPMAGAALLLAIWLMTAFVQVPLHARLIAGGGAEEAARLVRSNWLRTLAWTARGVIVWSMLGWVKA